MAAPQVRRSSASALVPKVQRRRIVRVSVAGKAASSSKCSMAPVPPTPVPACHHLHRQRRTRYSSCWAYCCPLAVCTSFIGVEYGEYRAFMDCDPRTVSLASRQRARPPGRRFLLCPRQCRQVVLSPLRCYSESRWLSGENPTIWCPSRSRTQAYTVRHRGVVDREARCDIGVPGPDRGFVDNMVAAATQQGVT